MVVVVMMMMVMAMGSRPDADVNACAVMVVMVMMMSDHNLGCSGAAALGQTLIVGLRSSTPTLSNIPSCLALWWLSGVY
jgi:hypothetical protein